MADPVDRYGAADPALRVAILVGNEVLRRGLEAIVTGLSTVDTVRRLDATGQLDAERFDVLLVSEYEADRLDGLREALAVRGTKVLMLITDPAAEDLREYGRMGVDGFLYQQELDADSLRDALARCAAGQVPMPAAVARALLTSVGSRQARVGRPPALTAREMQALRLLAEGLSNGQIGRRLGISSHGAKRLVASIMIKLGSPNRTTAVVTAIRAGLVDGGPGQRTHVEG
jgi:two-component system, NarL family, nitrate/nitrite response regulator NarL